MTLDAPKPDDRGSSPVKPPQDPSKLYDKENDAVRLDSHSELDDTIIVALRSFFRKLGAPYLVDERILPTAKSPDSMLFAAVRDRPWPPWGHGSRRIIALMQVHSIGQRSYGLSPLYIRPEEASNIGLRAALYKEVLESLSRQGKAEVSYLVIERSVLTAQVLTSLGFARGSDVVVTDSARYSFYRSEVKTLLAKLQLDSISIPELLTHQAAPAILDRNALLQGVLDWGRFREIIAIDGGSFDAALPGGTPPTPPTAGPDLGRIGIVEESVRE
jgi:hypothetical protein